MMGIVLLDISVSLDGYITGPNDNHEQPLGDGGRQLHDWVWRDKDMTKNADLMQGGTIATTGVMVVGRRTYDLIDGYGGNHPLPGVPLFVVSRDVPKNIPKGHTPFTFVTDGIESAITRAKAAAGDKNVYVIGGANVAQQCINAGLLDEIRLHVAHVLLGGGVRLFDHLANQVTLEKTNIVDGTGGGTGATHFRFRVVK
jgi:dihydrofolate reductase